MSCKQTVPADGGMVVSLLKGDGVVHPSILFDHQEERKDSVTEQTVGSYCLSLLEAIKQRQN